MRSDWKHHPIPEYIDDQQKQASNFLELKLQDAVPIVQGQSKGLTGHIWQERRAWYGVLLVQLIGR